MAEVRTFEDLRAWQCARVLVKAVYVCSRETQLGKDFGLRDQICRSAVSAMSNIAEGFSRKNDKEFLHYLNITRGSLSEVQSLLYVALDAGFIDTQRFRQLSTLVNETASVTAGLSAYLRGEIAATYLKSGKPARSSTPVRDARPNRTPESSALTPDAGLRTPDFPDSCLTLDDAFASQGSSPGSRP